MSFHRPRGDRVPTSQARKVLSMPGGAKKTRGSGSIRSPRPSPVSSARVLGPSPFSLVNEVQRVPEIFTSPEAAIDARRSASWFIHTGSAKVLRVPRLAESLAGRMGLLRLLPLSRCELECRPPQFIDALFAGRFKSRVVERRAPSSLRSSSRAFTPSHWGAPSRRAGQRGIATTSKPRFRATCATCRGFTR